MLDATSLPLHNVTVASLALILMEQSALHVLLDALNAYLLTCAPCVPWATFPSRVVLSSAMPLVEFLAAWPALTTVPHAWVALRLAPPVFQALLSTE